jgi:hypothetical protein
MKLRKIRKIKGPLECLRYLSSISAIFWLNCVYQVEGGKKAWTNVYNKLISVYGKA